MAREVAVDETSTMDRGAEPRDRERSYVLVVTEDSSTVMPLPRVGVVMIGRGQEAGLRLDHTSVSRAHARLIIDGSAIRIEDLESYNGTRVNGESLAATRRLDTGDVVAIGDIVLVVHAAPPSPELHGALDETAWRQRLSEEVARATTYQRTLSVLAVAGVDADRIRAALRPIDIVGRGDEGDVLVILPETEPPEALARARELTRVHTEARCGIACCPYDALDAGGLTVLARAAARIAAPIAVTGDTLQRRQLGNRTVLIGHPSMLRVYELLKRLAAVRLPVLIVGETGVGKENAAFSLHFESSRRERPFVALNCAALPEQLVESQLFGHERGAFTGASAAHEGLLESASGGTVFLDEIGELALPIQAKLLRAIESQEITRVGDNRPRTIDVRFVAATNRQLEVEVEHGRFRRDLFFRLSGAKVFIPPLRDRRAEIAMLFRELFAEACARSSRMPPSPVATVVQRLLAYGWPGNVRELLHVCEYLAATVVDDRIEPSDLPEELIGPRAALSVASPAHADAPRKLADEIEELERRRMSEALALAGGVRKHAAELLGMPLRTFTHKLKQYALE